MASNRTKRFWGSTGLALVVALILSTTAMAQDSSVGTYGGGGQVSVEVAGSDPGDPGSASASADDPGALPFTGLDLGLAIGGGVLLLGLGVAVGRMGPAPTTRS